MFKLFNGLLVLAVMSGFMFSASVLRADKGCGMEMSSSENKDHDMSKMEKGNAKVAGKEQKYNSPQSKKGDTVICPVMKNSFKVTDKSLFVTIKGKKYYVCCSMCPAELKKNPDKYLK